MLQIRSHGSREWRRRRALLPRLSRAEDGGGRYVQEVVCCLLDVQNLFAVGTPFGETRAIGRDLPLRAGAGGIAIGGVEGPDVNFFGAALIGEVREPATGGG